MLHVLSESVLLIIGRIHFSSKHYVWFEYNFGGETFQGVYSRFDFCCYPVEDGKIVRTSQYDNSSPQNFIHLRHGKIVSIKKFIRVLGFSLKNWENQGTIFHLQSTDILIMSNPKFLSLLCRLWG
jgi:hypothetical protein